MCTRNCCKKIGFSDITDLLQYGYNNPFIRGILSSIICDANRYEIMYFLPFIAHHLDKNTNIYDYILNKYLKDIDRYSSSRFVFKIIQLF